MKILLQPFKKFVCFNGRASRYECLSFVAFCVACFLVTTSPFAYSQSHAGAIEKKVLFYSFLAYMVSFIILFLPLVAVMTRRLHDTSLRGWWIALSWVSFLPAWVIMDTSQGDGRLVGYFLLLAPFVLTLLPGDLGPNKFGEVPNDTPADKKKA